MDSLDSATLTLSTCLDAIWTTWNLSATRLASGRCSETPLANAGDRSYVTASTAAGFPSCVSSSAAKEATVEASRSGSQNKASPPSRSMKVEAQLWPRPRALSSTSTCVAPEKSA